MAQDIVTPWAEVVTRDRVMTAAELADLPDDGWRYELVKGRLLRMPPAGFERGGVALTLGAALHNFVAQHALGRVVGAETGFLLSSPDAPETVLAPEVAFVRAERLHGLPREALRGYLPFAPDLVAEVASPDQSRPELATKARAWLAAGVRLVWVLWPAGQRVDVWRASEPAPTGLDAADTLDGADVLPGFTVQVGELFR